MNRLYAIKNTFRWLLAAMLLFTISATAQRYSFYNLNVENGLIQSQVTSITQDQFGHLWIGTLGGLSRFDGKNVVNYTVRNGMLNNAVNALAVDKANNLWIGGHEGISQYDGRQFRHYVFQTPETPGANSVAEIKPDKNGTIWCRAGNKLYTVKNGKTAQVVAPDKNALLSAVLPDDKTIWIAKVPGIIYTYRNNKWDSLAIPSSAPTAVLDLYKDSRQRIWAATNTGLYQVTHDTITPAVINGKTLGQLPPIMSVAEDKSGVLWLGTNSGAFRLGKEAIQYFNKKNGLTDNAIYATLSDAEGNVWLASDGQGLFRYSGSLFSVLDESMGLPSAQIMSIAADSRGKLYLGTFDAGLYTYENGKVYDMMLPFKKGPAITALKIKRNNEVWIGTRGVGLWRYNGVYKPYYAPTIPSNLITALYLDQADRMWIGTSNGAVVYEQDSFRKVALDNLSIQDFITIGSDSTLVATTDGIKLVIGTDVYAYKTGAAPDSATSQCFALKGRELWIGSSDNGLICYNLQTKKSLVLNKANGLQSDFIYNIIVDNSGNIWAGTGYGIHKIKMTNGHPLVTVYGKEQSIKGMESNHNAVFKMPDGSIWFGTTNGALLYKPSIRGVETKPISIALQSIKVFGENITDTTYYDSTDAWYNVPQGLRLPYKKNNITFTFQAVTLSGAEQIQYRYQVEGLNEPWSEWSPTNTITYSALPPGKYTLHVESRTGDTEVMQQLSYPFEIIAPFHKTGWFRLVILAACILLGVSLQYLANRRKQNRLALMERLRREEQTKVRLRTAEDFHDEIGNKLTRINVLTNVLKNKIGYISPETRRILEQIQDNTGQLYGGTRDILWSLKPSNDNLYEIMHRIRDFGGELFQDTEIDFEFSGTDERWRTYRLPLDVSRNLIMIFKEALNNCLKYAEATEVRLEVVLKDKDEAVQMVLTDNGKGFDIHNIEKGHGLQNMQTRAKRINGIIYIDSRPGNGTIINLNFKLPTQK